MRDTPKLDTSFQVVRRQPQSASMSTNSHYYKSASHYPSTPTSNHEHHYGLGPTWQDANQDSPAGPLPAGVGPSFNHYAQAGGHSVTANNSTIPSWPSGYDRQIVPPWTQQGYGQSYGARSANSYPPAENASANRHDPAVTTAYHQQHQELNTEPKVPLTTSVNAYRDVNRFSTPMASPATVVDPPFSNHDHGPQPLSRQSQSLSRASPPDTTTTLPPPTTHAAWEPPQEYPVQAESKFVTSAATAGHLAPAAFWAGLDAVVPAIEPVAYGRVPEIRHSWGHIPTQQHEQPQYVQQQVANDGFNNPADQAAVYTRPPGRKKVPKVPSSFVERQEKQKISKRKGPLQEGLREKTHKMRKVKRICVRCRFYKSGCDCGDPCEKCLKTIGHARSFHEPCFREHLEDASLVRHCNGREHQQVAEFLNYEWLQDSNLYDMEIVWNLPGYGPIPNAQPLQLVFRPYAPKKALDVAASVWTNNRGQVTQLEQPAYAIYDTASLVAAFEGYFSGLQPAIERWIYDRVQSDEIACLTYREVARMRSTHGSKVLDLAMKMQCLSVVSQGYGSVWSNNIPGIREYDYSSLGRSDYEAYDRHTYDRPLPGAMAHQMDVAAVKYLAKLEKAITKELVALIFKPKIKPWYELFLAFYVIFWNLNYIQHGAHDYIKSKNGTLMENQVSNVVTNQIEKWEWAVPVILYHWRCILRGYSPFKLARDNPEELRERGHIDPEGFDYVTRISEIFDKNNPDRSQPPQTGFASNHWSGSSQCIMDLFKMSGA